MAAPAIGQRRLWLPPTGQFRVDWGHPHAASLKMFITGDRVYGDGYIDSATPAKVPTRHGWAMDMSGNALRVASDTALSQATPPGVTIASIAMRGTGQIHMLTSDVGAGITGGYVAGGAREWQLRLNSPSSIGAITFDASAGVVNNVATSGVVGAGVVAVVAVAIDANKTLALRGLTSDGARISGTGPSTGTAGWDTSVARFSIGNSGGAAGWVLCSWYWQRTLSASELGSFVSDPFAMLRC